MYLKKIKVALLITAILVTTCFGNQVVYAEEISEDQDKEKDQESLEKSANE